MRHLCPDAHRRDPTLVHLVLEGGRGAGRHVDRAAQERESPSQDLLMRLTESRAGRVCGVANG